MNIRSLDLNLIRVFDAMIRERSVTRAAKAIGLSQPAMSSALNRLRMALGDPLFVRAGQEMVPTARASEFAGPARRALAAIEEGLNPRHEFEMAQLHRSFGLLGADFFSMLFMPHLSAHVLQRAPNVKLRYFDSARGDIGHLLQEGEIDLAFEHDAQVPAWISHSRLFRSSFVVVLRSDHPYLKQAGLHPGERLSFEAFGALDFAVYSLDGGETGCAAETLRAAGLGGRISLALPHFQATAIAAANSNLAALIPCQLAEATAAQLDLAVLPLPLAMPVLELEMYWHKRVDDDPQHRWLRAQVTEVVAQLGFDRIARRYLAATRPGRASA